MILNIADILKNPGTIREFSFSIDMSDTDICGERIFQEPVLVHGSVANKAGAIDLSGSAQATAVISCARCLRPVVLEKDVPFHNTLVTSFENENDDDEKIIVENGQLDVGEIARTAMILDFGIRVLCSPECKGLCPQCGKDLNEGPCGCPEKEPDTRMSALKKLLDEQND